MRRFFKKRTADSLSLAEMTLKNYKGYLLLTLIASVVTGVSAVFTTQVIGNAVDYMVGYQNVNFQGVRRAIIGLGVLFLLNTIATWAVTSFSARIAYNVSNDLRKELLHKLTKVPLSYYDQNSHGDIISRFTGDLDSISDALALTLGHLFSGVVTIVCVLGLMFYNSWQLALVVLLSTPLNLLAVQIVTKASQSSFEKQQNILGDISGFISEIIGNQKLVKALGYQEIATEEFEKKNQALYSTGWKAHYASAMTNPSTRIVEHISYIAVGVVGGLLALVSPAITVGTISKFLIFSGQFAKPFNDISGIMTNIQIAVASYQRVRGLYYAREETPETATKVLSRPEGYVEFRKVDFSYQKKTSLIENLTLSATPGQLVAIVGPTGAGKTTIVNLLMRFYEIDAGEILIDGNAIQTYTKDSLRKSFGMVLQDTWLLAGTIAENIAYGKEDASREEIIAAAKAAHAHSFIQALPYGYDTVVDEQSDTLSSGQKQLLTIARVMLTDPSLLILDEATSSIDSLTEIRVQKAFLAMMEGRTSFVIAHRLSTIEKADIILVLDQGKIIETGNHKELLEQKGFYYQLYQSQFS